MRRCISFLVFSWFAVSIVGGLRAQQGCNPIVCENQLPGSPSSTILEREAAPTLIDVPYYYSDFTPIAAPAVEPIVTYDWRSPVFFDVP